MILCVTNKINKERAQHAACKFYLYKVQFISASQFHSGKRRENKEEKRGENGLRYIINVGNWKILAKPFFCYDEPESREKHQTK